MRAVLLLPCGLLLLAAASLVDGYRPACEVIKIMEREEREIKALQKQAVRWLRLHSQHNPLM